MALLEFGGFRLDVDARRIYSRDGELAAEPKVIEVLCYLIQHRDRLVPLAELHAEVWPGRVVTDTAVRRTISKLRALLGDTDPDAPLYIKSQMKRGYQFIGEALPVQIAIADADAIRDEVVSTIAAAHPNQSNQSVSAPKASRKRWYWLAAAMALFSCVLAFTFLPVAPKNQTITTKPLVSVAGEKIYLSVSPNGRYHGFTGRLNKTEGWQPFIYDRQLGHLKKIKLPDDAIFATLSVINNDRLFVIAGIEGDLWAFIYEISNLNTPLRRISLNDFKKIGQAVPFTENLVLVNVGKKNEKGGAYYSLDLGTETFTQFTFSSSSNSFDSHLVVSPDKKYFAFIRVDAGYKVQVYRSVDKTLLLEDTIENKKFTISDLNLAWLDNQRLLINAGEHTKQLNIVSGLSTNIQGVNRFSALDRDASGQLFGLLKQPQTTTFYQFQWSQPDFAQRYFNFEKPPLRLNYSRTPDHLWLVEEHQNSYQLNHYQPETGEKKTYYTTNDESFRMLAEGQRAPELLLWSTQKQLQLLDKATGQVTQIADVNQQVAFASFATDDKDIFFIEKIGEEWQVNIFDRQANTQRNLMKGYRIFLPWQQQFIAADVNGQFFLLDGDYQVIKQLQLKLDFTVRYQIGLRDNQLFAANLGLDTNWRFFRLDLDSDELQQHVATTLPIKTLFSFSYDGQTAIATVENDLDSELVELNVDGN
ncbi:MAG: transcriptional regulator [Rheinheimera sp.]